MSVRFLLKTGHQLHLLFFYWTNSFLLLLLLFPVSLFQSKSVKLLLRADQCSNASVLQLINEAPLILLLSALFIYLSPPPPASANLSVCQKTITTRGDKAWVQNLMNLWSQAFLLMCDNQHQLLSVKTAHMWTDYGQNVVGQHSYTVLHVGIITWGRALCYLCLYCSSLVTFSFSSFWPLRGVYTVT